MTSITNRDIIEEIKSKLDIVKVISETVLLHKKGNEYVGAISSGSKSGESLKVSPQCQLYHDFAGHAGGGDVFNWIAYLEGLDIHSDFPRILEIAAQKGGVVLEQSDRQYIEDRKQLLTFNRAVAGYYHSQLTGEMREYIHKTWGINDEMIDKLMIGWAPENCHLQREMKDMFPVDVMIKSGFFKLTSKGELKDHYRGRIIFPYWKNGSIVYSIGRDPKWSRKKKTGKYIKQLTYNEEHPHISKSVDNSVLYGEDSIQKSNEIYITEGVADCIRLLQEGISAVSPVTTRIRKSDEDKIVGICRNKELIRIINDNEENESGLNGALRTAETLEANGIKTEIVELPRPTGVDKIDVAEYLKNHTKEDILQLEGKRIWHIRLHKQKKPNAYVERVEAAHNFIQEELGLMPENLRRSFVRTEVKEYFDVNTNDIIHSVKSLKFKEECYFDLEGRFVPSRVSEMIQKEYNFVTMSDTDEIMVYNSQKGYYEPTGENLIKEYTQKLLGDASRKKHVEEVVFHVKNSTRSDRCEFDKENGNINLKNGVYNLYTYEFKEHSPAQKFTHRLPFNYDPKATCKKFDSYLDKIGLGDKKTLIYEIFGYCLVPGYSIQVIFIFEGDGGNGKGTVSRVLRAFLGAENITGASIQALEKNPYAMAGLYGKLALICGDMPSNKVRDTSFIKTLSGGDLITAQVIYKGNIEFVNRAKLIFLMNHVPEFDDNTDSLMRRLIPIRFNVKVEGMDKGFDESELSSDEELSGIFNKIREVLPDLLKKRKFSYSMPLNEVREYVLKKGNHIAAFADECGFLNVESQTPKDEVYAAYVKWCSKNGITCMTERAFKKKFMEEYRGDIKPTRPWINNERVMCYAGYELKDEWSGFNLQEELEKYEVSREPGHINASAGKIRVKLKTSDFQTAEAIIDDFGQIKPAINNKQNFPYSDESNEKNVNEEERICKSNMTTPIESQKQAASDVDNSNFSVTSNVTKALGNVTKVKELMLSFASNEKYKGVVNSSKLHDFALEFKSTHLEETQGYTYKDVEDIAAKVFCLSSNGIIHNSLNHSERCVDCGSDQVLNKSQLSDGLIEYRCDGCYYEYANKFAHNSNQPTERVSFKS